MYAYFLKDTPLIMKAAMMTGTNKIDKTIYASLLIFKSSYKNGGEKTPSLFITIQVYQLRV
jgi:hypothetical protein